MMNSVDHVLSLLKKNPKVMAAILFGSRARGSASLLSDTDLAVVLKDPTPEDEAEVGSLYSSQIDLALFHRLTPYVQYEVLKEGKVLFVRDREYLTRVIWRTIHNFLEYSWMYRRVKEKIANESRGARS